jgi:polysaccharide biosynthesis protein PslE
MLESEMSPPTTLNLYRVLLIHRRPMVWTFSGIMLLTIAVTFFGPKTYTSEAKLFVRLGRESMAMDPTATAGTDKVVMVQESREYEINSVFELLKSREVLSSVVGDMGPRVVLEQGPDADKVQSAGLFASVSLLSPYSIEDAALKRLAKDLNFMAIKKSNVINISYHSKSPELSRDIVASVIKHARDAHIRVNRTDGSHEFFATQTNRLRDRVIGLERELRDLKNSSGIASLEDQRTLKLRQIATLQESLLEGEASRSAATAQMQAQEALLETIPEKITTGETTGMPHSALSAMREQLFTAQVQEKELLSRYTKEHPLAMAVSKQVAELQAVIDAEPVQPQIEQGPNAAHQEISLSHFKGEAQVASLRAQTTAIREQLASAQGELTKLNDVESEITRLEREIDIETANYKKYSDNLEQARIDAELVTKNISNLNVLQAPTYSITPTKPRRTMNLAMGLFGGLAASLCVGLLLEERRSGLLSQLFSMSHPGAVLVDPLVATPHGPMERHTPTAPIRHATQFPDERQEPSNF